MCTEDAPRRALLHGQGAAGKAEGAVEDVHATLRGRRVGGAEGDGVVCGLAGVARPERRAGALVVRVRVRVGAVALCSRRSATSSNFREVGSTH